MLKLIFIPVIFIAGTISSFGQQQSAIYDATAIMNAKFGLTALLIPLETSSGGNQFDIFNSQTGERDDKNTATGNITPYIRRIGDSECDKVILEILRRNANLPAGSSPAAIKAAYSGNPFLSKILDYSPMALRGGNRIDSVVGYNASLASGSIGSNLLGNVVNGTADFLIKRAHEEISISVIEKLKKLLELHPEFITLFPRTCALLEPIKAYEYSKVLAAFKAAIKEDMESFVSHISDLYDIPRYQLLNQKVPALSLLFTSSSLFSGVQDENSFAASVAALSSKSFMGAGNNYTATIRLLTILSNSLLDQKLSDPKDKPLSYISKSYISKVTRNDPALQVLLSRVYLGLLWQKAKGISFITSTGIQNIETFLNRWDNSATIENAIKVVDKAVGIMSTAEEELKAVKDWEQQARQISGKNQINVKRFTYYATLVSGVSDMLTLFQDPASPAAIRLGEIRDYLPQFTTSVATMIKNISEEEYNLAISSFEQSLKVLSSYLKEVEKNKSDAANLKNTVETNINSEIGTVDAEINLVAGNITALGSGGAAAELTEREARRQEYVLKKTRLEEKKAQLERQKKNVSDVVFKLSKIINYINLLAAITKAENSAAVEKLLETYALPAGSSRVKKVTSFNIAINSYVGGFFGRSGVSESGFTNHYGFTTPIGCTFSTGFNKAGSASVFISAFDIGGTVKYKLNNQGKYEQGVTLAGIISPGIHLVYGFPFNIPLSAGVGYQWISPVTENTNNINLKSTFSAFIGIDIPLFNLTRSK